jgi:hypothetical protein
MYQVLEDHAKQRLTERVDIITAVGILSAEGLDTDEMLTEMTKLFYVDLDEFNDVMETVSRSREF